MSDAADRREARALDHLRRAEAAGRAVLSTSLSAEDQVLAGLVARGRLGIELVAIDTGRLHAETLDLIAATEARLDLQIRVVRPDAAAVEALVARDGAFGFYDGREARLACCNVRKVAPLAVALDGADAWVTGRRREQSEGRDALDAIETEDGRLKVNPLVDWTWAEVLESAARLDAPLNPLLARGYVSIGCEPCTRALKPGEHPRAARWWWEEGGAKECGLHVAARPPEEALA